MKTKDVPQDDANMMQGLFREPVYSLDENGEYTTVKSVGWDPKNAVMQHAWDEINEKVEAVRQQVIDGKLSPIAFYIEKNIMDVGLLAKYVGLWKWTVKRHLNPKIFNKLSDDKLQKYADIFQLSVADLKNIERIKAKGNRNED